MTQKKTPTRDLTQKYAAEINAAHDLAQVCAQSAIDHAIKCGELLIAMKKRLKQGTFTDWVKEHCTFSHDTCNVYMRSTRAKTRGLVFSSLAALLAYERSEKRGRPEKFLHQELTIPPFGLPEGHDPMQWAYAQSGLKLLAQIVSSIRYVKPLRVARGAATFEERFAMEALAHRLCVFAAELRNIIAQINQQKSVVRPFAEMQWIEIGKAMNTEPANAQELLEHADALLDKHKDWLVDPEHVAAVQRMNGQPMTTMMVQA